MGLTLEFKEEISKKTGYHFIKPISLALDKKLNLLVIDLAREENLEGEKPATRLLKIDLSQGKTEEFVLSLPNFKPELIRVSQKGNIYLAGYRDSIFFLTFQNSISSLAFEGKFLTQSSSGVSLVDFCLDSSENLYLVYSEKETLTGSYVQIFNKEGQLLTLIDYLQDLKRFNDSLLFAEPLGLASSEEGRVFLSAIGECFMGRKVVSCYALALMDLSAKRVVDASFHEIEGESEAFKGFGSGRIALDGEGTIFVTKLDGIVGFEKGLQGNFFQYGSLGRFAGQFNSPADLIAKNSLLYVTDTGNARIQVFEINYS